MTDDDLYVRYQTLAALVSVLLHDLRNPLHSGTLLVEALGSRTADIESIRGKLRNQFGKLEGLISEATDSMREVSLEPRLEPVALDQVLIGVQSLVQQHTEQPPAIEFPPPSGLDIVTDRAILTQAIAELISGIAAHRDAATAPPIVLMIEQVEPAMVKVSVGNIAGSQNPALAKAPFAIGGGAFASPSLARFVRARQLAQARTDPRQRVAIRAHGEAFGLTSRSTPRSPATRTTSARPMNRPVSTTPGISRRPRSTDCRIGDGPGGHVVDEVSRVGDYPAAPLNAKHGGPEARETLRRCSVPERKHLHGDRPFLAQTRGELTGVDHDHIAARSLVDDLLAGVRGPPALDQVEIERRPRQRRRR